jgi:hypothetical protein
MTTASDKEYPLVTETGETFLTWVQLARYIREKCGDQVGIFIEKLLEERDKNGDTAEIMKRIMDLLYDIDISQIESNISEAMNLLEKVSA